MAAPPAPWKRSFRALNVTQLLGAFNDNLFKNAIALIAAGNASEHFLGPGAFAAYGDRPEALVSALFTLPFILLGAFAGALADRHSKSRMMVLLKGTELVLMLVGALLFGMRSPFALLVLVVLMAGQSAFFGPNKYGSMPEILPEEELSRGNAVIQMTTYAAIIAGGWSAGQILALLERWEWFDRLWTVGACCAAISVAGLVAARRIRFLPVADPQRALPTNPARSLFRDLRHVKRDRELLVALLLGALFLMVGTHVLLATFTFAKDVMGLDVAGTANVQALLAVGIGIGSLLAGKVSGPHLRPGLVPIGSFAVAGFLALLAVPGVSGAVACALFFLAGCAAGFFVVPVRAIIQQRPDATEKGRVLGLAQVLDFGGSLVAAGLHAAIMQIPGVGPRGLLLAVALITAVGVALLFAFSGLYLQGVRSLFGVQPEPPESR